MKPKTLLIAAFACCMLALTSHAQVLTTNLLPPATILENLEMTPNQLVIKATLPLGSLNINDWLVNVVCKEDTVPATNQKQHGIYIEVAHSNYPSFRTVIDFDELDSFINAVDYLNNVNWSITSLSSFNANYTTKAGLRVAAYSSKRSGQIEFSLRNTSNNFDLKLAPEQRTEFRALLDQARTKLVALRNG